MHSRWTRWDDQYKAGLMLAMLALIYTLLVYVVLPRQVFFCSDEGEKMIVVASSVRSGDWWRVRFEYPGLRLDPDGEAFLSSWMRMVNGQPVPFHLSTMNFWNAPLYALWGIDGLYVLPLLSGLGIIWLTYRLARLMAISQPWVVVPLVGLCTPVLFYSLTTWDHMPVVFYVMGAICLLARQAWRTCYWQMGLAGVCIGLAVWTRIEMYLFVPIIIFSYVYTFRKHRYLLSSLFALVAGFAIVATAMIAQQVAVYGHPDLIALYMRSSDFALSQGLIAAGSGSLLDSVLRQAQVMLILSVDASEFWLERVFMALAFVGTVLVFRSPRLQRFPLLTMGSVLMQVIGTALTIVHSRLYFVAGLVPTVPLAAWGLAYRSAKPDECLTPARLVLEWIAALSILVLLAGLVLLPSYGGSNWGPRYLAMLFPLLPTLAWTAFWRAQGTLDALDVRRAVQIAFGMLVAASLVVQGVGVARMLKSKNQTLVWYDHLDSLDVEFVLSDHPWYLQHMAALYFEHVFLCPRTQEVYNRLLERMYAGGVRQFAWVSTVDSQIDPQIKTAQFAVHRVQDRLYEISPSMTGGNE